jgi:hypothetical protein
MADANSVYLLELWWRFGIVLPVGCVTTFVWFAFTTTANEKRNAGLCWFIGFLALSFVWIIYWVSLRVFQVLGGEIGSLYYRLYAFVIHSLYMYPILYLALVLSLRCVLRYGSPRFYSEYWAPVVVATTFFWIFVRFS